MRLDSDTRQAVVNAFKAADTNAQIFLFGSRIDDRAKGGDIDLLIDSDLLTPEDVRKVKLRLYAEIGEQKMDCLLKKNISPAFLRVIEQEGLVQL
jgi:predicted nucleotidyltransferase